MTLDRMDYSAAILTFLAKAPARLHQIVLTVAEPQNFRAVDYDVRRLRMSGKIRTVKGVWELVPKVKSTRRPAGGA